MILVSAMSIFYPSVVCTGTLMPSQTFFEDAGYCVYLGVYHSVRRVLPYGMVLLVP